jgi:hypothetical protein
MVLSHTKILLPLFWGIITLLPAVLAQLPIAIRCYNEVHAYDHRFRRDCSLIAIHEALNQGSFSELHETFNQGCFSEPAACTETPGRGSQHSLWWKSYGHCIFSFTAKGPLSTGTWQTVIEDFKAIQRDCVSQKGVGGNRFRLVNYEQPETGPLFVQIKPQNPVILSQERHKLPNP